MKRSTPLKPRSKKRQALAPELAEFQRLVCERDRVCQGPARGLKGDCWGLLAAHHIDRDRTNNDPSNGVALCGFHHTAGGNESAHGNYDGRARAAGLMTARNSTRGHNHVPDSLMHFGCAACIEAMRAGEITPEGGVE